MTERDMGMFGLPTVLPTVTALSTVAAMTFFVCLLSQGSLGPNIVSADLVVLQRGALHDDSLRSTHYTSLNLTDVPRTPRMTAAAPAATSDVQLASLNAGEWGIDQSPYIVPFDEPLQQARTKLVALETAPFPDSGTERGTQQRASQTYSDNRVLLHIPEGFDANRPAVMIVFFHGHRATLERDVWERQQVPAQVSGAGINAVLVAPQFAVDAADSNPGKFANPGAFARFLDEAARQLARLNGDPATEKSFAKMPVVLVAYSGGFVPCAWAIHVGGIGNRVRGVVLLDALYGELDKFVPWITKSKPGFFVSAFTQSTQRQNNTLEHILAEKNVAYSTDLGGNWRHGVTFLSTSPDVNHRDYVTRSWTENPIQDVLARLDDYKLAR